MTALRRTRSMLVLAAACAISLAGCALLRPPPDPARQFRLEGRFEATTVAIATPRQTLLVTTPAARAGYDVPRIAYVTKDYELQYFARSEWIDTPARMLAPLLAEALERGGKFQTVQGSSGVSAPLRLDTEILSLQQEFGSSPSVTRFSLRAQLVDVAGRRLLATQEFEAVAAAATDDPYGGVVAGNAAVRQVLLELVEWAGAQSGR